MPNPSGAPRPGAWPRPSGLPARTLAEVAERLGAEVAGADPGSWDDAVVTGVTLDSRAVRPGDLYAAPAGSRAHGADFAAAARAAGAVACLTDAAGALRSLDAGLPTYVVPAPRAVLGGLASWLYGDPSAALTMLGVTGTNGKTTTAYLLEAGLRAGHRWTGLVGTIETRIGDDVLLSERTTPESTDLQALLAVMRERGVDAVAMEVSSHALAMGRVDGTTYDVALFTNLSEDHLDFHADLEEYFQVKATLFTPERSRRGVVDVDDAHGRRLVGLATVPVVTVSPSGSDADWRVVDAALGPSGSEFVLVGPDGARLPGRTRLAGDFNLANAALAVVALVTAGVEPAAAAAGVAECPGVPGRMERVDAGDGRPLALVDFAHTPDALARLLAAARGLVADGGRLLVVVGCGGDRDRQKRPAMGAIAVRGADVAVLTSDNPRSEDPAAIVEEIRRGADDAVADGATGRLEVEVDRRAAVRLAAGLARAGDVLVVAGKGHEQGQEVAGVVHPFDDRVELAAALREVAGVIPLSLTEIATVVGGTVGAGSEGLVVRAGASADSRAVPAGGLFVAVVGERVDGHDYAEQAVASGAVACLVQRPVGAPHVLVADPVAALGVLARHVVDRLVAGGTVVVGVTGSSGKTSTKDLLAAVLEPLGPTVAPRGSYNTEVGVPVTALEADPSTRHLVVEMGARGVGHIAYLCGVTPPRVGVVLNVGAAHAGEFGSTEATARAKSELVAALPADGVAVLNADDPLVAAMAAVTRARVVRTGLGPDADVRAERVQLDGLGRASFVLTAPGHGPVEVSLPLHGAHHVGNALAAAAVALELGATVDGVAAALATATPRSRWRMEVTERADGVTVVNGAYNANPDSVAAALAALAAMAAGRRSWAVLGEMLELGAASAEEHARVGRLARRTGVDRVVAVGDGARPVHAGALAEGAVDGEGSVVVTDARAALDLLRAQLRPGDVVLVKASRSSGLEAVADALLNGGRDDRQEVVAP